MANHESSDSAYTNHSHGQQPQPPADSSVPHSLAHATVGIGCFSQETQHLGNRQLGHRRRWSIRSISDRDAAFTGRSKRNVIEPDADTGNQTKIRSELEHRFGYRLGPGDQYLERADHLRQFFLAQTSSKRIRCVDDTLIFEKPDRLRIQFTERAGRNQDTPRRGLLHAGWSQHWSRFGRHIFYYGCALSRLRYA